MFFSIIIPMYNKEKHINKTIDSVLAQTYQKYEIIVVDDGSTDSSSSIVQGIQDDRIKLYKKENKGVSSARNYGIEISRYDYICFLDADDEWRPSYLNEINKLILKYPKAGAYASLYEFNKGGNLYEADINLDLENNESNIVDYFKGALHNPLISASSVTIPRLVFENIGNFSEKLTRGEDLDMWCRIALNYNIAFVNTVLARYNLDAENRSTDQKLDFSKTFMSRAENILENQQENGNKSFYFEEYMISRIMPKIRYLINNQEYKQARIILKKYKHTKYNKKKWFKNYLLSYKIVHQLYGMTR